MLIDQEAQLLFHQRWITHVAGHYNNDSADTINWMINDSTLAPLGQYQSCSEKHGQPLSSTGGS